jgi:hypothetical protein
MGAGLSLPQIRLRNPEAMRLFDPCDLCASALYLPGAQSSRHWMEVFDETDDAYRMHDHPFLEAITNGDTAVIQRHLASKENANTVTMLRDGRGNTPAHTAARFGRLEALELLAWYEPKLLYEQNEVRNTPAHTAAEAGQVDVLRWLGEQVRCVAAFRAPPRAP